MELHAPTHLLLQKFVSLALKNAKGEKAIKYTYTDIYETWFESHHDLDMVLSALFT